MTSLPASFERRGILKAAQCLPERTQSFPGVLKAVQFADGTAPRLDKSVEDRAPINSDSLKQYGHGLENYVEELLARCEEEGAVFMYELHQNLAEALANLPMADAEKKQLLPQLSEIREYVPDSS